MLFQIKSKLLSILKKILEKDRRDNVRIKQRQPGSRAKPMIPMDTG